MLEEKSKDQAITVTAPEAPARAQIIDLMQALKQSIEKAKPKQKAASVQRKQKPLRRAYSQGLSSALAMESLISDTASGQISLATRSSIFASTGSQRNRSLNGRCQLRADSLQHRF